MTASQVAFKNIIAESDNERNKSNLFLFLFKVLEVKDTIYVKLVTIYFV